MATADAQIIVRGNVGKDPELKFTKSGLAVAKFSVAVTERVQQDGEWMDGDTTWFDVTCWRGLAEDVTEGVRKGQRVSVGGRFKLEKWDGDDGVTRTTAAVTADWVGIAPRAPKESRGQGGGRALQAVEAPF